MTIPFSRVDERITGWVETRSVSTRKQSIKQVISKLHELSNGLFARGMLDRFCSKAAFERGNSSRLNKSQQCLTSSAVPSSRLALIKMRHTNSAFGRECRSRDEHPDNKA